MHCFWRLKKKIEIVQLLLANQKININIKSISYDKKNKEKKFKTSFHLAIEKYIFVSRTKKNKRYITLSKTIITKNKTFQANQITNL